MGGWLGVPRLGFFGKLKKVLGDLGGLGGFSEFSDDTYPGLLFRELSNGIGFGG